jgi:K+-transporting ATPase ATPase C chain
MAEEMWIALRVTVATLLLTGLAYPLLVTGIAAVVFPQASAGTLVRDANGEIVGSLLIGQPFARPEYLQPRPSAAGTGYDAAASGGSNLGATSQKLHDRAAADVERLRSENPAAQGPVPADLVTASASGLDPHVSPAAAFWQVPRIARARGVEPARVETLIADHVEPRTLGILGEPRVNVLAVNLALDERFGRVSE